MEKTLHIEHPYTGTGSWYKGNIHMHSRKSDGGLDMPQLRDLYRGLGFDFICVSDHAHDGLDPSAGIDKIDTPGEFAVLSGYEAASGGHVNCIGATRLPDRLGNMPEAIQAAASEGGFSILNHPSGYTLDRATGENFHGIAGIEITNSVCMYLHDLFGPEDGYAAVDSGYALTLWDQMLSQGRRLWGFSNDDFHGFDSVPGISMNWVRSEQLEGPALLSAMKRGDFYASTGVRFEGIEVEGGEIRIRAENAGRVRFSGPDGEVFSEVAGEEGVYAVRGNEGYVRAEATNDVRLFPNVTADSWFPRDGGFLLAEKGHTGERCCELDGGGGVLHWGVQNKIVNQKAPKALTFGGWVQTGGLRQLAGDCECSLSLWMQSYEQGVLPVSTIDLSALPMEWSRVEQTVPLDLRVRRVAVRMRLTGYEGKVRFDDLFLRQEGSPENLLVNPSFEDDSRLDKYTQQAWTQPFWIHG